LDPPLDPTVERGHEAAAVTDARRRLARVAGSLGRHHPDFAASLNQLALLLLMQGDAGEAEPLLREALEVRRETLGEGHPDVATNLSSLGGLLWARGDIDEAEPMLRQAVEIRRAVLGPSHPKTVVSLNNLDQLLRARREAGLTPLGDPAEVFPPEPEVAPGAVADEASVVAFPSPAPPSSAMLAGELDRLAAEFADLGDHLSRAARGLISGGAPPPEALAAACAQARASFLGFLDRYHNAAESHGVKDDRPGDLEALRTAIETLRGAETARAQFERRKRSALAVLDRVDRLICPSTHDFDPLEACRDLARSLRRAADSSNPAAEDEQVGRLADGSHPLVSLLRIVGAGEGDSDEDWAAWFREVETGLGHALAVAAARSRVVEPRG
jgi:hypothetical protein